MENHANSTEELAGEFVQEEVGEDDNNEDLSETKGNDDINQEREMTEVENDQSEISHNVGDINRNEVTEQAVIEEENDDDNHSLLSSRHRRRNKKSSSKSHQLKRNNQPSHNHQTSGNKREQVNHFSHKPWFSRTNVIVQKDYSISFLKNWDKKCSSLPDQESFTCYDQLYDQQWNIRETWASDHSSFSYMLKSYYDNKPLKEECTGMYITSEIAQ